MRAVVTRVKEASVTIEGRTAGAIGKGFLVLLGVHVNDTEETAKKIADRICGLRVFEDPGAPDLQRQRGPKQPYRCMNWSFRSAGQRVLRSKPGSSAPICRCHRLMTAPLR